MKSVILGRSERSSGIFIILITLKIFIIPGYVLISSLIWVIMKLIVSYCFCEVVKILFAKKFLFITMMIYIKTKFFLFIFNKNKTNFRGYINMKYLIQA